MIWNDISDFNSKICYSWLVGTNSMHNLINWWHHNICHISTFWTLCCKFQFTKLNVQYQHGHFFVCITIVAFSMSHFACLYKMLHNATSITSNRFVNSSVAEWRISTKDVKSKFSHCIWMKQSWKLCNQTKCCPQASVCFLKALQRQSLAVKVTLGATVTAREWRDSS